MIQILSAIVLSTLVSQATMPVRDGTSRDYSNVPKATITTDVFEVGDADAKKDAEYDCNREVRNTESRIRGRGQKIIESRKCVLADYNEPPVSYPSIPEPQQIHKGYYEGEVYFN